MPMCPEILLLGLFFPHSFSLIKLSSDFNSRFLPILSRFEYLYPKSPLHSSALHAIDFGWAFPSGIGECYRLYSESPKMICWSPTLVPPNVTGILSYKTGGNLNTEEHTQRKNAMVDGDTDLCDATECRECQRLPAHHEKLEKRLALLPYTLRRINPDNTLILGF